MFYSSKYDQHATSFFKAIHIFTARRYHLVPQIIESFLTKVPGNHQFVLIGDTKTDWLVYENLLKKHHWKSYLLCPSFGYFVRHNPASKSSLVLLHGVPLAWMIFFCAFGFNNIHWMYWGGGTVLGSNLKDKVSAIIRMTCYRKFRSIITTITPDCHNLRRRFAVKEDKLQTIPYPSILNSSDAFYRDNLLHSDEKKIKTVYLGNNSMCMPLYLISLDILKKFRPNIRIECMLNYSLIKNETYYLLKQRGLKLFGDQFCINTSIYALEDYPDYMNRCDIYICSRATQSGIGAIYTLLKFGKMVYLNGHNFEFFSSLGCKIKHVDALHTITTEEFLRPLTVEERLFNYDIIINYTSDKSVIPKWEDFFHRYGSHNVWKPSCKRG